jgi:hypothetical protein
MEQTRLSHAPYGPRFGGVTAKALRLIIPPSVWGRADELIQ